MIGILIAKAIFVIAPGLVSTISFASSSNIEMAIAVLNGFTTKNTNALYQYIDENIYIQHNPNSADGREELVKLFEGLPEETEVTVLRAFEDAVKAMLQGVTITRLNQRQAGEISTNSEKPRKFTLPEGQ